MSVSITAVQCTTFQNNWADIKWAILGQTRLRMIWVYDTFLTDIPRWTRPMIGILNHIEKKQKKNITCSQWVLSWFRENSLSHNFAKRRTETTYKNPVIIFKSLRMAEYEISVILRAAWYWTMRSDFWDARVFVRWTFKHRDFIQISMITSWS